MQWCPLYKSGSSSWMAVFAKLTGALSDITEEKIRKGDITFMHLAKNFRMFHNSAAHANLARGEEKLKIFTMVVVRHPFKRILSAYRDKLERIKGREYYSNTIGKAIIKRFRRAKEMKLTVLGKSYHIITSPFGVISRIELQQKTAPRNYPGVKQKIVSSSKIDNISSSRDLTSTKLKDSINLRVPTFEEFCKYLVTTVDQTTMNEHWRPQYLDCSPCHHKFDLILKLEEIDTDKMQVFKLLDLANNSSESREVERVWNRWINRNTLRSSFNDSWYYSQLSHSLMNQLYELYKPDFQLFDYSPDEYFGMLKK